MSDYSRLRRSLRHRIYYLNSVNIARRGIQSYNTSNIYKYYTSR